VVAQFTGFDEMGDGEEGAEQDAETSYHYVSDPEEGITSSHYCTCGNNDGFCAAIFVDREHCDNVSIETSGVPS